MSDVVRTPPPLTKEERQWRAQQQRNKARALAEQDAAMVKLFDDNLKNGQIPKTMPGDYKNSKDPG